MLGLLHADNLILCGELEDLMVGCFEVCRRGLKVNVGKSMGMVLGGEEGLECGVCVASQNLNSWDVLNR